MSSQRVVHLLGADPVEQDVDLHAGARALGERVGELLADASRPVDVGLERDRLLRAADRREHRGKDLVPVQQRVDAVAFDQPGPEQHAHGARELRVVHAVSVVDLAADLLLLAHEEVHGQQHECRAGDEEAEDLGDGEAHAQEDRRAR
jgi:hypothetical protein